MDREVQGLRARHNFAPDGSIRFVAAALRKNVDARLLEEALSRLPENARKFWTP
jgi:uncharacterized protein (DUF2267 family)